VVRVDADKAVIRTRDEKANTLENDTLVLLREGVEVAWFASWDYATIDSALESVNE